MIWALHDTSDTLRLYFFVSRELLLSPDLKKLKAVPSRHRQRAPCHECREIWDRTPWAPRTGPRWCPWTSPRRTGWVWSSCSWRSARASAAGTSGCRSPHPGWLWRWGPRTLSLTAFPAGLLALGSRAWVSKKKCWLCCCLSFSYKFENILVKFIHMITWFTKNEHTQVFKSGICR